MSIKGIASLADLMEDLPAAGAQEVALFLIDPDPHQPRTSFDELRLDTLAASVAAQGVIEPLIVSLHPETPGRYLLVAGERRWRAAGMAGLTTVAVVIRELTAEQRLAVQLIENIDREALSILEESSAVVRLIEFGRKPKDVAGMLGKTQAWVSLRRKIADHRSGLEHFVAEDRTRDAETLAMLVDLEKIDRQAFSDMHQVERITRRGARGPGPGEAAQARAPGLGQGSGQDPGGLGARAHRAAGPAATPGRGAHGTPGGPGAPAGPRDC